MCQCPHGLVPHCYADAEAAEVTYPTPVSMPSRASTSLLHNPVPPRFDGVCEIVSMPSRASTSLLLCHISMVRVYDRRVSMPSRASTSLLRNTPFDVFCDWERCQCPHGLVPHCYTKCAWRKRNTTPSGVSMPSRASTSLLLSKAERGARYGLRCQCPHGLVPHCYQRPMVGIH